ncbi:arsenical pump-driving ATPase [Salibacterium aidingense]|uniref:arsenical pump-driving ATPase n=1 Tax=Salibacterium aidingense TaxID=384933 RepID=UPI0004084B45|nr:arsenical pump-driving ATPase [Salibacterium aidingense]
MEFQIKHLPDTKHLFFTGKGGVGKTSIAAASAVALADQGQRVLIVSTDPASNLQDVFSTELSSEITAVPGVNGLSALNIDPEEAARTYREKVISPYRGKLPEAAIQSMEEQLSGACTVEIAAFDEFSALLGEETFQQTFDYIVFDTAPTGHTLRLLQLPAAWSGFLETSTHGASCLGPMAGLKEKEALYHKTRNVLADPAQTALFLVSRPETSSLYEAGRASEELRELNVSNQYLVINGLHPLDFSEDPTASAYIKSQQQSLKKLPQVLDELVTYELPLLSHSLEGVDGLRSFFHGEGDSFRDGPPYRNTPELPDVSKAVEDWVQSNTRLIMTMGKGGVGKTTTAAAIALDIAKRGYPVHLTTTDPADHLGLALTGEERPENLTVSRIDAKAETERYKQDVLCRTGNELDEESLAYLKEDLDSPCTEEIAVFYAFATTAARAKQEFVVLDTAPTGHTLLLLDAAESYHQEVLRASGDLPPEVKELLPRLRNPAETAVGIVTLPEAVPVLEAGRLEEELHRAGILSSWWIINHSFLAASVTDPLLHARASREARWIEKVTAAHPGRTCLQPYSPSFAGTAAPIQ